MSSSHSSAEMPDDAKENVPQETCLANARIVLRDRVVSGCLILRHGEIAGVEETSRIPAGSLDCEGDFLLPGLIELHTDNLERHLQPRPGVDWPVAPALLAHDAELAATGITTVFDALRIGAVFSGSADLTRYARTLATEIVRLRAAGLTRISHFLHLRAEICSDTLIEDMEEFGPEDRIGIVSLMDHTPGQRQFRDISKLRDYLMGKKHMSLDQFHAHIAHLQALSARIGARHEAAAVREAARYGAVLASHDDTTAEQVAVSKAHGARLAEFPTTVEAAEACRAAGIAIVMGAPNVIRGTSHSGNVSALELAGMDLLDIVSSDYVPAALMLSAFRLGAYWDDLPRAVRTVTEAPARASGLTDRGVIEAGKRADVVRVHSADRIPVVRGVWSRGKRVS